MPLLEMESDRLQTTKSSALSCLTARTHTKKQPDHFHFFSLRPVALTSVTAKFFERRACVACAVFPQSVIKEHGRKCLCVVRCRVNMHALHSFSRLPYEGAGELITGQREYSSTSEAVK